MGQLLLSVVENSQIFLSRKNKSERKNIGQFFTDESTAIFMAKMFELSKASKKINILDPGAGSGILSAAFIEEAELYPIEEINLTLVENNSEVLEVLKENAQIMMDKTKIKLNIKIIEKNYITMQSLEFSMGYSDSFNSFDYVISNPPYKKILRNDPETIGMEKVISGAPNLYFLFMALAIFNLKKNGELVFIIPRSWTSGAYFKKFREYCFSEGIIENIHLFVSRKDVFKGEKILQETMIIRFVKKEDKPISINITSSESTNFVDVKKISAPYNVIVHGENSYIFLPTDEFQIRVLKDVDSFNYILPSLGLKAKTGVTVDFKNKLLLRTTPEEGTIPLLYSSNIKCGRIIFPSGADKKQFLLANKNGLIQKNKDYLLLKRLTSKEENRRLQVGIYLKEDLEGSYISTDNKLNFIEKQNGEALSRETIYGLFCLFNSSIYDEYYRIMNGSTQVNATEINQIPIPSIEEIELLGKKLININDLSTDVCDTLLDEIIHKE